MDYTIYINTKMNIGVLFLFCILYRFHNSYFVLLSFSSCIFCIFIFCIFCKIYVLGLQFIDPVMLRRAGPVAQPRRRGSAEEPCQHNMAEPRKRNPEAGFWKAETKTYIKYVNMIPVSDPKLM